jgi:methionyl aminopeptidase
MVVLIDYLRYGLNRRPAVLLNACSRSATLSAPGVWILSGTTPDKRAIIAAPAGGHKPRQRLKCASLIYPSIHGHFHKTAEDIAAMRLACRLAAEVLDYIEPFVKPGITTAQLDKLCHDYMVDVQGCIPAPLNYAPPGYAPYPKSICASVNHQVCHGVPNDRALKKGDIVNLDITTIKDGWHGDTSRTFCVGETSILARRLVAMTHECMWVGIAQVKPGVHLGAVGAAIQKHAEGAGYSVVGNSAATASAATSTRNPRCCTTARPDDGPMLATRHGVHHRADDQRRQGGDLGTARRLDHRHQGPQPCRRNGNIRSASPKPASRS